MPPKRRKQICPDSDINDCRRTLRVEEVTATSHRGTFSVYGLTPRLHVDRSRGACHHYVIFILLPNANAPAKLRALTKKPPSASAVVRQPCIIMLRNKKTKKLFVNGSHPESMVPSLWNWTMKTNKEVFTPLMFVILSGCFASILMFWVTTCGPGVSPDSVTYIETARSLLAGNGFYAYGQPMTQHPPLYPLLLCLGGFFLHGDVLQAARILCALFYGANVLLLGSAVFACTKRSLPCDGLYRVRFLASAPIMIIHSMAWSEAPFIMFTLASFMLLSFYVVHPSLYLLIAASLSVGLSIVTRYVGITLYPSLAFAVLFFGKRSSKRKIIDILIASIVALLPIILWFYRNIAITGNASNRELSIHVIEFSHIKSFIITMVGFILPDLPPILLFVKIFLLGAVAALSIFIMVTFVNKRNHIKDNSNSVCIFFPSVCIIFAVTYFFYNGFDIVLRCSDTARFKNFISCILDNCIGYNIINMVII